MKKVKKKQPLSSLKSTEPEKEPEPEPDQPTPTPPSDQDESPDDSDNTAATTHNTAKRRKKGEMEDVYTSAE